MWSNKDSIAIHFTGIRPWKANTGSYIDFTAKPVKYKMLYPPFCFTLLLLTYESSSYTSLERPKSEIFIFLPSATRTFRAARSLWTSWTARDANLASSRDVSETSLVKQPRHWNLFFFHLFSCIYVSNIRTCSSIDTVHLCELYSTFISARYCMPLEICHANEIRSPMVSARSSGFSR